MRRWPLLLPVLLLLAGCPLLPDPPDDAASADDDDDADDDDAVDDDDSAGDDDTVDDDDSANDDDDVEPCDAFTFVGRAEEDCPWDDEGSCNPQLSCATGWPPAFRGTVELFTSSEQVGEVVHDRSFHVYFPADLEGPVPLLILLHGGGEDGTRAIDWGPTRLADARGSSPGTIWYRNNEDCRFRFGGLLDMGFEDPVTGEDCTADLVQFTNDQRFVVVYPDGLLDAGEDCGRHWEDGRSPSPGSGTVEERRDDLGFVDHIIAVMLEQEAGLVDPERIYLAGGSNGGLMTGRVLCHLDDPCYPNLGRIAAASVLIATMAEPIVLGLDGRPQCPASGTLHRPVQFVLGDGIDTPDCAVYPCEEPVINGDGLMPYGEPGGAYHIPSPSGGRVIAAPDAYQLWLDFHGASGLGYPDQATTFLGYFTDVETAVWPGTDAEVVKYRTDGGSHFLLGTRMDFSPQGRMLDFLMRYRRLPDGQVVASEPSPISGDF